MTLPHKGKMLWCSYFRSCIKSINLNRCRNFIEQFNFFSTPWKIIIPKAHHPLNTPSPMPPPTFPAPPTSLTSTPLTPTPTNTTHPTTTPPHYTYHTHHPMTPYPTTTHLTTPTPPPPPHPQRKNGALMPDISWAPPHNLPIL